MSKVEKMSVSLTPTLAQGIRDAVEDGSFGSSSEVVRDAVRLWIAQREENAAKLAWLRAEIQKGVDSGPAKPFDPDFLRAEAKRTEAKRTAEARA